MKNIQYIGKDQGGNKQGWQRRQWCMVADRLGGSNGDGAQRGTVTIPVLAPYENHPDQH